MVRPDYREFTHSSKGSTWENHKYIKRLDGTYYYPDSYEGGRHLSEGEKDKGSSDEKGGSTKPLGQSDIETLAKEVIRGNFGNGETRKQLLGENYEEVQSLVNIIIRQSSEMKRGGGEKNVEAKPETPKKKESAPSEKKSKVHSGVDLDQALRVYRKEKN